MKFVRENLVNLLNCKDEDIYNIGLNCIDLSYDLKPELLNIIEKIKHVFEIYTIQFYDENYITLTGAWKNVYNTTYINYNDKIFNPVRPNEKIHSSIIAQNITNVQLIRKSEYIGLLNSQPIYLKPIKNSLDPRFYEIWIKMMKLIGDDETYSIFKKIEKRFQQQLILNEDIEFYEIWYLDDKTFDLIISNKIKNIIINENTNIKILINTNDMTYIGFILKEDLDEHIRTRS